MIRFVDLGNQTGNVDYNAGEREFAFYSTVTDTFMDFARSQTWSCRADFIADFKADYPKEDPARYVRLIPSYVV